MYELKYWNYHVKKYILFPLFVLIHLAGYAKSHKFNPDDPNEDIKDNEFLYPFSEECKEEKRNGISCKKLIRSLYN